MHPLNKNHVGLTLGIISGIGHLLWVLAIAIGLGQKLLDWSLSIHFISSIQTTNGITLGMAVLGIVYALVCGYIVGWVFAAIWNWVGKK